MTNDTTVVILAAGLGTRMRSRKAKVLHEAGGLALIEHVVRSAMAVAAPERIVVVVGYQAEQVESLLAKYGVRYVRQTEQLGTGHALMQCRDVVDTNSGRLIVAYGDGPLLSARTLERLLTRHEQLHAAGTVIVTELEDPTGYGRALMNEAGVLEEIVEQKVATPEQLAVRFINTGIYCFESRELWSHMSAIKPNPVSQEYYLTDIVELFNKAKLPVGVLIHEDPSELLGINTKLELAEVDRIFRDRKARELMLGGVTIRKPETVTIDVDVEVGMDSIIESGAHLRGQTRVGESCSIGVGCVLTHAVIADNVALSAYTVIDESSVGAKATLGPFARLRPGNTVEEDTHIGNFVELKKTRFRKGAKAGHLSYLGDSDIGAETNIGAGTITCNYDGRLKHQTQIGDNSFIGSNSTLVAPVSVGAGAYVAAGSVITDAVPEDALALGRSRQVLKDGWAKRRRETKS